MSRFFGKRNIYKLQVRSGQGRRACAFAAAAAQENSASLAMYSAVFLVIIKPPRHPIFSAPYRALVSPAATIGQSCQ